MRYIFTTLLVLSLSLLTAFSAKGQNHEYESETFVSSTGENLNYRFITPEEIKPGKKYPLVLFLHGAGERGNDNEKQLVHGSQMFLNPVNREKHPAFVLFPQCPLDGYWSLSKRPSDLSKGIHAEKEITPILNAVMEMLQTYMDNPSVDCSRVYIMGLSMGAMATYDLVSRFPDVFAAAIPICGCVKAGRLGVAKDVKFRIYHGDADNVVPVKGSRDAYKELKAAGAKVEYIEFPGCNHASWIPAFNQPDFMDWLFAQKKSRRSNRKK